MNNQELNRDKGTPSYQRLRTMVRQHIDQTRTRNFKARNERIETGVLVKRYKGIKEETSSLREEWESAFSGKQLENVRKEAPEDNHGSNSGQRAQSSFSTLENADTD